jgi:divalent metal cation (Fe/Co/Zn/Cd) transporter
MPAAGTVTSTAAKPKHFWSPLWGVFVVLVMQYVGCQMLWGAVEQVGSNGGLENATAGANVMFVLMVIACFGGPLAFWIFAHKMWGR